MKQIGSPTSPQGPKHHLRLGVDIGAIVDELPDHLVLTCQGGDVQRRVPLLQHMGGQEVPQVGETCASPGQAASFLYSPRGHTTRTCVPDPPDLMSGTRSPGRETLPVLLKNTALE